MLLPPYQMKHQSLLFLVLGLDKREEDGTGEEVWTAERWASASHML